MISEGYKKIFWGILLSGFHMDNIMIGIFTVQIIPAFIGYYLIYLGVKELCEVCGLEYMEKLKKDGLRLTIFSIGTFVYGLIFGYGLAISKAIMVLFYLIELLFYGDLLNKTVKYFKENNREKEADKLRGNRMKFIKAFMALIALHLVNMIPQVAPFTEYACLTLMFMAKIWLTLMINKLRLQQM